MKPLSPSLKERKRYILIYIDGDTEKKEVEELVTKAGSQFLGEFGMSHAGVQLLPETWDKKSKKAIIRVGHKYTDLLRAALTLVSEHNGKKVRISTIKTSGSLKKLKEMI